MQYVISSPGRTGSHYLLSFFYACALPVLKTHDPLYVTDYTNTTLCIMNRRDVFASLMSKEIWLRTNEYLIYTNKKIEPFSIDLKKLERDFINHIRYDQQHDFTRPYANVVRFEFEDLMQDHNLFFDTLKLEPCGPIKLPQKSPYDYRVLVTNLQECEAKYKTLCSTVNYNHR